MRSAVTTMVAVAVGLAGAACGDSLTFPELPSQLLADFCVQGTATVGETVQGTVSASDCDAADARPGGVGYYDVWRVRVSEAQSVTFDADSPFDNYLTLLRLDSFTQTTADLTVVDENDDRAQGNLNALLSFTLQPDTDYFIAISGFDYDETGSYSLVIR